MLHPRLHGLPSAWRAVLDDAGAKLRDALAIGGEESIAIYQGTGHVLDSLGMKARADLVAQMPGIQFYSAATVDVAPALVAAETVTGWPDLLPVWTPENRTCRFALFLGFNPLVSHGYVTMLPNPADRIRSFQAAGGALWVVDPKVTRTAKAADRHLSIRPASDAWLLAWLLRELLRDGRETPPGVTADDVRALQDATQEVTLDRVVDETGLTPNTICDLVEKAGDARQFAIVAGTGITLGANALLVEWLRWAILAVTGSLDSAGGMMFDPLWLNALDRRPPAQAHSDAVADGPKSRPDLRRVFGEFPSVAIADEIAAGRIRCLIVLGGNPLTALPDPERTIAMLGKLDALIVLDILDTPLGKLATHVLPVAGQLERADVLVESHTMLAPAVVPPVGSRKASWRVLAELGERMGTSIFGGRNASELTDEDAMRLLVEAGHGDFAALQAAGPEGIAHARRPEWVRHGLLADNRWRIASPAFLARLRDLIGRPPAAAGLHLLSGRQIGRVNSTGYVPSAKSRERPTIHINPADAANLGIADGQLATLKSDDGSLLARAEHDRSMPIGGVALAHGWPATNTATLVTARRVDPLTGQPAMTALAVEVIPA
ncbi:formate dehydrogenase [Sphingomonas sp. DBB INV C78]|uniref:molybdopterin dinucleotide binding domain-containing protein n=1 Tax=Sphingomonas sp. DBB INV C78 TaxID=3349434 RepID=UPI0036D4323C